METGTYQKSIIDKCLIALSTALIVICAIIYIYYYKWDMDTCLEDNDVIIDGDNYYTGAVVKLYQKILTYMCGSTLVSIIYSLMTTLVTLHILVRFKNTMLWIVFFTSALILLINVIYIVMLLKNGIYTFNSKLNEYLKTESLPKTVVDTNIYTQTKLVMMTQLISMVAVQVLYFAFSYNKYNLVYI